MINEPTTLVLGAGASMPYGMPSGAELRSLICHNSKTLGRTLADYFVIDPAITTEFTDSFLRSSVASIDAFLAKRNHYTEIGKLCIASTLCARENQNMVSVNDINDHWYHTLWQTLIDGVHSASELSKNKIRFITFNYDRSLEYFLHQATKHTFGVNDEVALQISKQIEILHVYGMLGDYHYIDSPTTRAYSNDFNRMQLQIAANGILVIPEARENNETFKTARNWFNDSKVIGFLGFGFDTLNVQRLGLGDVVAWRNEHNVPLPRIIASMYQKTNAEIGKIARLLCPTKPSLVQTFDGQNTTTIRMSNLLG